MCVRERKKTDGSGSDGTTGKPVGGATAVEARSARDRVRVGVSVCVCVSAQRPVACGTDTRGARFAGALRRERASERGTIKRNQIAATAAAADRKVTHSGDWWGRGGRMGDNVRVQLASARHRFYQPV